MQLLESNLALYDQVRLIRQADYEPWGSTWLGFKPMTYGSRTEQFTAPGVLDHWDIRNLWMLIIFTHSKT